MAFHNIPPNGFPDIPDMEELEAVVKDVSGIKTSVAGLSTDVSNLSDNKANQITIAPFFDPEASYEVGDLVYYNGLSYRCTNDHEGEWDADDFAATTIAGELDTLKSGLTSATDRLIACNMTGQIVDLTSYTSANPFLIPNDGYVFVFSKTKKSTIIVSDHTHINNIAVGSLEVDSSLYVKAGMYAFFTSEQGATDYVATYKPLS